MYFYWLSKFVHYTFKQIILKFQYSQIHICEINFVKKHTVDTWRKSTPEAQHIYIYLFNTNFFFICSYHAKAIRNVNYHKRLPLFASCSDDGSIQIFHGMVYNDLLQNPLIVPVKILKGGHQIVDSLGNYYWIIIK